MRQFYDLPQEEQEKCLIKAREWYVQHTKHVDRIISLEKHSYPPSGSDCYKPELWKSGSWKWFMDKIKENTMSEKTIRSEQVKSGLAKKVPVDPVKRPKLGNLKVYHIPQVPMKAFEVDVETPQEAKRILDILANYDIFQFENNVKPDYSNAGGLTAYDGNDWVDWEDEDGCSIDETTTFQTARYLMKK